MAEFDANNNAPPLPLAEKSQEKYSLRPRASLKREEPDEDHEDGWKPSTRGRSTKRRQKPKPLSRYITGIFSSRRFYVFACCMYVCMYVWLVYDFKIIDFKFTNFFYSVM